MLRVDLASHNLTLSNSVVRNNLVGVHVLSTASGAVLTGNEFYSQTGPDSSKNTVDLEGDNALVEGNIIRNNSQAGINLTSAAQNTIIRANEFYANNSFAISASGPATLIEQNTVRNNPGNGFNSGVISVFNSSIQSFRTM